MNMGDHWEWLVGQALAEENVSHVTVLTDRMLFKPSGLTQLLDLVEARPDDVITYPHDKVVDHSHPVLLQQREWTGEVLSLSSRRLLEVARKCIYHDAFPRLLNSVAPRSLLTRMQSRFGEILASISPDFCFCFRVLGLVPEVVHLDKALLVQRATSRSNGHSGIRGKISGDSQDFRKYLDAERPLPFAPEPRLLTVFNAIVHEYCRADHELGEGTLPPIDTDAYWTRIGADVAQMEAGPTRDAAETILAGRGRHENGRQPRPASLLARLEYLATSRRTKPAWLAVARLFGLPPPHANFFTFSDERDAIDYALRFTRWRSLRNQHIAELLQ
jgi:hypothetical protein